MNKELITANKRIGSRAFKIFALQRVNVPNAMVALSNSFKWPMHFYISTTFARTALGNPGYDKYAA